MSCDVSLGRLEPCKKDIGGLVAVYFINYTAGLLSGTGAATDSPAGDKAGSVIDTTEDGTWARKTLS